MGASSYPWFSKKVLEQILSRIGGGINGEFEGVERGEVYCVCNLPYKFTLVIVEQWK